MAVNLGYTTGWNDAMFDRKKNPYQPFAKEMDEDSFACFKVEYERGYDAAERKRDEIARDRKRATR